jgi:hypothetical protein
MVDDVMVSMVDDVMVSMVAVGVMVSMPAVVLWCL